MNNIAIQLTNLSKQYSLHHEKPTLAEKLFSRTRKEKIWALKDISLTIMAGEKIGIVGSNGSGKTTLLSIIAGITEPTRGQAIVNGRVAALIGLEAGFHPELTGEENIYLNGMLLGMSRREIKAKLKQIIAFAELEKFIDVPLHAYSNGMKMRLGFSIAIAADPDILLIDEALSVGDQAFQKKSRQAIEHFFRQGKTIILVSHYPTTIQKLCPRAIWLENGQIKAIGKSRQVISQYQKTSHA